MGQRRLSQRQLTFEFPFEIFFDQRVCTFPPGAYDLVTEEFEMTLGSSRKWKKGRTSLFPADEPARSWVDRSQRRVIVSEVVACHADDVLRRAQA